MKKPALREKRSKSKVFNETNWTKSSKTVGQYIFRRLSLDQSDKELSRIRPRHCQSQLIVSSKEIDMYVSDYLNMVDRKKKNQHVKVVTGQKQDHPLMESKATL